MKPSCFFMRVLSTLTQVWIGICHTRETTDFSTWLVNLQIERGKRYTSTLTRTANQAGAETSTQMGSGKVT